MSESSTKIKTLTVKSQDDLSKWSSDYPEIIIFPADHEVRMLSDSDYKENEIIFVENNGEFWREYFCYPPRDNFSDIMKKCQKYHDLIIGGDLVFFKFDLLHDISLVSSLFFAANAFCRFNVRSRKYELREYVHRGEYGLELGDWAPALNLTNPVKMWIPLVVGYSSNEGTRLKYRQGGKYLRWTAHWNLTIVPLIDRLEGIASRNWRPPFVRNEDDEIRLLSAYNYFLYKTLYITHIHGDKYFKYCIEKAEEFWRNINPETLKNVEKHANLTLSNIHEYYRKEDELKLHLRMPHFSMLSPVVASESFEGNADFLLLDKDRFGWPVAVARKIGDGGVVFIPASADWESLEEKFNCTRGRYPLLRGWDLLQKSLGSIDPFSELSSESADEISKSLAELGQTTRKRGFELVRQYSAPKYSVELADVKDPIGPATKNFTIFVNGKEKLIASLQFLRFAGLWAVSEVYGGYKGSPFKLDEDKPVLKIKTKIDFPCIVIYRDDENRNPANPPKDRMRSLENVLGLNTAEINKDVLCLNENKRRKPGPDNYIEEKLHNVELVIRPGIFKKLMTLQFKSTDKRCGDYEKNKSTFFELLQDALNKRDIGN